MTDQEAWAIRFFLQFDSIFAAMRLEKTPVREICVGARVRHDPVGGHVGQALYTHVFFRISQLDCISIDVATTPGDARAGADLW